MTRCVTISTISLRKTEREKLPGILAKTWGRMSPSGQAKALERTRVLRNCVWLRTASAARQSAAE